MDIRNKLVTEEDAFKLKLEKLVRDKLAIEMAKDNEKKFLCKADVLKWILRDVLEVSVI